MVELEQEELKEEFHANFYSFINSGIIRMYFSSNNELNLCFKLMVRLFDMLDTDILATSAKCYKLFGYFENNSHQLFFTLSVHGAKKVTF